MGNATIQLAQVTNLCYELSGEAIDVAAGRAATSRWCLVVVLVTSIEDSIIL
jgi:hypothetical protein